MPTRRALLASAAATLLLMTGGTAMADVATPEATQSPAVTSVQFDVGIPYGEIDGVPLVLFAVHLSADAQPRPAVILVPSGVGGPDLSWAMLESARGLARAGYVAFAIEVRSFFTDHSPA
jgi:hypothetical protein